MVLTRCNPLITFAKFCKNRLIDGATPGTAAHLLWTLIVFATILITASVAHATDYYIDNSNLLCTNSGSGTIDSPWCDFTTFNLTTFQPGDYIFLRSGDTWNQPVILNGSRNATSGAITLTSYGSGPQPKIAYGTSTPGTVVSV